ncbi:MAG: Uncharacterized protein XE07_1965 [Methanothrix harundinacea]|uniref:Type I restriction modification DNA specificity domain-containing protein n=1 Tax=Methanothrix harundinacea TaxID=301375 RepID=A0A101IGY0_9EURY|nr:MAG: Uncharacterized protein XE07_1965 [Methanothrix harundinacea]
MEVKPGYKQTEVGVIPQDWDVKNLRDCLISNPDYGINAPAVPYSDTLPVYIRITDITDDGKFSPDNIVSVRHIKADSYYLNDGDLVFARTGASVGKSYLYNRKDGSLVFAGFLIRVRTNPAKLIPEYLSNYIQTGPYWSWVKIMSTRSGQPGINGHEYGQLPIPLPKTEEQRAIAVALSDVDDLITGLDQLIAKKRDIKRAAMQELLTGKRRLPGFSGEWVVKRLGDSAILKARIGWQGLTTTEYLDSGDCYLVTGTEFKNSYIDWSNCHFVDESRYKQDKNIQLKEHDVLVTKDGTIGKVALITNLPKPATLNSGVFVIRPIDNVFHPKFLYYLLCSNAFTDFLVQLSAGSTINHLYQKDFVSFTYKMPATIDEQIAIANVLSDMDAEITVLEARRDKTKALKQGMMQELLTGRIRLVEGGAA